MPPFRSDEDIEFTSLAEQPLLGLTRNSYFTGVLVRLGEGKDDLKQIDVYEFKDVDKMKIDKAICENLLAKIFGPLKDLDLKLKTTEILQTERAGNMCEAVMEDPGKEAAFHERRVFIGISHAQVYGLVFRFVKSPTANERDNIHDFVKRLR